MRPKAKQVVYDYFFPITYISSLTYQFLVVVRFEHYFWSLIPLLMLYLIWIREKEKATS